MCHSRMQPSRFEAPREERDEEARPPEPPVWERTTPRGNQEANHDDLDRSLERLETLVGN